MSLIEKLDSVLKLVGIALDSDERDDEDAADEAAFIFLRDHGPAIRQAMIDAERLREIAELIGCIFAYGDFKAETFNERRLEALLRENGTFWSSSREYEAARATGEGEGNG